MIRRAWVISKHTFAGFTRDDCPQLAAAISYYLLFSIVPLIILAVSVIGLLPEQHNVRNDIIDRVLEVVPLDQTAGRSALDKALNNVNSVSGPIAALSLIATLWTASSVFASIRKAFNRVWAISEHRPFAQQKLVDIAQVGVLGAILLSSLILTGVLRAIRELSPDSAGPLASHSPLWEIPSVLLPAVLTFVTFALLYRIVPAARPRWRDALPGALVATLLFEALKNSFAFYVANFNNFDVIYGSLAGVLLFLFFTYLSSAILLIGAELARTLPRVPQRRAARRAAPARSRCPPSRRAPSAPSRASSSASNAARPGCVQSC